MDFSNVKYISPDNSDISAEVKGKEFFIPVKAGNKYYDELVRQGITPAAYTAPVEPPRKIGDFAEFMGLFAASEQQAIATAAMQSWQIKLWYDQAVAENRLDLESAKVSDGMDVLVAASLITADRKTAILASDFDA